MTEPAAHVPPSEPGLPPRPAGPPLNWLVQSLCRLAFSSVRIAPSAVEYVGQLAERGSLVYVMRQRSWVDYVLVSHILQREGLPPPEFANDMSALWYRPLRTMLSGILAKLRQRWPVARELRAFEDRERCQKLVDEGRPVMIFMRSRRPRMRVSSRRRRSLSGIHSGRDYLREIVHRRWTSGREVYLVPIAVLRGRGMRRKESRLATLVYSVQEMPSELRRLISLLWNLHNTGISVGMEVPLRDFTRQHQREGEERIVRRLTRALQIFLYREERVVWGPPLLPKRQVRHLVLGDREVKGVVGRLAAEGGQAEAQLWRQAGRYMDEMTANFHGIYFAILELVFNRIWPRMFQGLEYSGLEKVVQCVKQHPVVLVPCHRSHFDYLILSYVFHMNYLSPPHIAAGVNLSFWPLGPLFRGAGAYFIRRTFEGNDLYKVVFQQYLTFLIREGYTQEFFIEGGRSRTGKIQTPKLGMLSAIVDAFIRGVRRDLYFVPVSIHYGRVVEEEEYQRELGGAEKQPETLKGLLQAGRMLRRRHGTVYLTFAEPISLNEALGAQKEEFRTADEAGEQSRRRFTQKLGFRILREVNDVSVAGATSVSATVLLSSPERACREADFVTRAEALVRFLRYSGVRFTASLERNAETEFRESLSFLENGGLIQRLSGAKGDVIHVPGDRRLALDFYKNNTIHFFLLPALLCGALARGQRGACIEEDVRWWLDLFRWEFPLPERQEIAEALAALQEYLCAEGAVRDAEGRALAVGHPFAATAIGIPDNFRESYWVTAQVLMDLPEAGLTRRGVAEQVQTQYRAGMLLGELHKPEGNSSVTLGNALNRCAEIEAIQLSPGTGREQMVCRGPKFDELEAIEQRVAAQLAGARSAEPRIPRREAATTAGEQHATASDGQGTVNSE